ncbi:pyridoxal phosphate-dependent transferase [Rhodotorula diobovata]|uniref:histidinol-phosphate transaminase n=1 Tax=Rhodotorula diobovata TaxID=5288 RepID=A0A5C5FRA7_9BASI|nr:pyridoxal phosphate-dependent transferase [Rhodotorula diobovata]
MPPAAPPPLAPTKPKPQHWDIQRAVRKNILALAPYRCARDDYDQGILLDANENALGHALPAANGDSSVTDTSFDDLDLHRYPSPTHYDVKQRLCELRGVPSPHNFFLGVGSDEVIDLLFRIACVPGRDRALVCPPTYGMYSVCAQVNDVEIVKVDLDVEGGKFRPKVDEINRTLSAAAKSDNPIKLIYLCSPGNPTGTLIPLDDVRAILANPDYEGLVVVDEAYIDFASRDKSAVELLVNEGWSNLVIMQTLSKGFGLAAIRLGIAISSPELIQVLNNIKAPYNISTPTASLALRALSPQGLSAFRQNISTLLSNRSYLASALLSLPSIIALPGAGDANFLLAQVAGRDGRPDNARAKEVYTHMAERDRVVVRFRGNEVGCEACLRITVGTRDECERVVERLRELLQ